MSVPSTRNRLSVESTAVTTPQVATGHGAVTLWRYVRIGGVRAATRSAADARGALEQTGWEVLETEVPLREAITQSAGDDVAHPAFADVAAEIGLTAIPTSARS